VWWWLFKRLQKCVEGALREHVHFVNQINLVAATRGSVLDIVEQVHFGSRSRIDLNQIDKPAFVNLQTGAAFATWLRGNTFFAIECFRENAGNRRFSYAPGTCKQVRVMQPAGLQCVDQGLQNMLLTDRVGKVFWPPFACQNEIAHR